MIKKKKNQLALIQDVSTTQINRLKRLVKEVDEDWNEEQLKLSFVFPLCRICNWKTDADHSDGDKDTSIEVERFQASKGRLDLLLVDQGIPRIVIECKKPSVTLYKNGVVTDSGVAAMHQVHRYAQGVRYWRKGQLPNILSVVTNGKEIIYFDSSIAKFNDAKRTMKADLVNLDFLQEFYQKINVSTVRANDLAHLCQIRTIFDAREAIKYSSTHQFSLKVLAWLKSIKSSKISKEDALAMTLQVLFLTVARDHGILGSEEIEIELKGGTWDNLFEMCKRRFNSNVFEKPRPRKLSTSKLDKIYKDSKDLPYSLEAIPVEYVGDIYETLLHNLHLDTPSLSKTSYYTPNWLVKDIIHKLNPTKDNSIFDPTCGSAAFLTYAFDYVTRDLDFKESRKFLQSKMFGVDRDELAVQVSRFALLISLARKVDGEWKEKKHILPSLTEHIVVHDFLTYETDRKFDFAVGNPPWGAIDHEVRDKKIKHSLKDYESYRDKTDICIYVLERAFNMLSDKGNFSFLVQRSVIDGEQHSTFREWWNGRVYSVWDFERDTLFAPRNQALTAVITGKVNNKRKLKIENRSTDKIAKSDLSLDLIMLNDYFHIIKGAESGKKEVFDLYAEENENDKHNRYLVYPEVIGHGVIKKKKKSYFIHPDTENSKITASFKKWLKNTKIEGKIRGEKGKTLHSCEWWLNNRAEVKRNKSRERRSLAWLWLNDKDKWDFSGSQPRIVLSYYLNGDRLKAGLDLEGEMIPLTSTTVLIPREGISKEKIFLSLAWLNSKMFASTEAHKAKLSASGGRALYRDYLAKMGVPRLPQEIENELVKLVKKNVKKGFSEHVLAQFDDLFLRGVKALSEGKDLVSKAQKAKAKKDQRKRKKG